jgi:hypothetical protein
MARRLALTILVVAWFASGIEAAEWYAAAEGKADAAGTKDSPWDLQTALLARQKIGPGDTLWLLPGTYKHSNRKLGSQGYEVRLAGTKEKPIQVRGMPRARVTIDGALSVVAPSDYLWIRDLELIISENATMSRTIKDTGSSPGDYGRPWGGLNVHAGRESKFINLVIHDTAQGISLWSAATDTEVYGCIIYDNGWKAPDRGHGHAIYTQNQNGIKTISHCIMTGGYGHTMHAYGSSRAYVDNYVIEENICYDGGTFLVGGGRPSRNIRVLNNCLYRVPMQIGYSAPYNEDCDVRGNLIVQGGLSINKYRKVVNEGNVILRAGQQDPVLDGLRIVLHAHAHDPDRFHLAVFNFAMKPEVSLRLGAALEQGERYRVLDPREFYGKPVTEGTYTGDPVTVAMKGEFVAFVLLKQP